MLVDGRIISKELTAALQPEQRSGRDGCDVWRTRCVGSLHTEEVRVAGIAKCLKGWAGCALICLAVRLVAHGQMPSMPDMDEEHKAPASQRDCMPGMAMPGCPNPATPDSGPMQHMHPHSFLEEIQHHASAGTSAEPNSTPAPMVMWVRGNWMVMLHGLAFLTDEHQSGQRGADKAFSTNWVMPMAQREFGRGQLTVRAMFSLEPATGTGRQYPP